MTLESVFEPEVVRDIFSSVVHEIGHVLDKNSRFSPGSKAVIAKGGHSAYVNSRIEIQADAQAFARQLLVMYGPEGKIDPRMIGNHVGWDGTYLTMKRYKYLDERSKRIFTLYVMNELERLGMLA